MLCWYARRAKMKHRATRALATRALANARLARVLQVKHREQRSKRESMQPNDKETGILYMYYTFTVAYRKQPQVAA
jgi:hypothetical protein